MEKVLVGIGFTVIVLAVMALEIAAIAIAWNSLHVHDLFHLGRASLGQIVGLSVLINMISGSRISTGRK